MLTSNASPIESTSPFYKQNEEICERLETYFEDKGAVVSGKYNAYSYIVVSKLPSKRKWTVIYRKSTYLSSGNLLLSSKSQSLNIRAVWKSECYESKCDSLKVRRKKWYDGLVRSLSKNAYRYGYYTVFHIPGQEELFSTLSTALDELFLSKELYSIIYEQNILTVEILSEELHFACLEKLIKT